jgi:hypothetical protein
MHPHHAKYNSVKASKPKQSRRVSSFAYIAAQKSLWIVYGWVPSPNHQNASVNTVSPWGWSTSGAEFVVQSHSWISSLATSLAAH